MLDFVVGIKFKYSMVNHNLIKACSRDFVQDGGGYKRWRGGGSCALPHFLKIISLKL